ncbi:MAG: hypothetical protein HYY65_14575 [Candidatus Tectomicrobia bacterium]|uniref:Uncharacterized protein n=1 Tax=Tectimicrobiota bacterium TaxID=2528274 RepID=A0A932GRW8_UNCTE|nr:hypothetical protein [Candidatus Tectomicrobia bacterium]
MNSRILVVVNLNLEDSFLEAVLDWARKSAGSVMVLQILTSDLYHYGHNDLLAGGRAKADFLLHIRREVLEKGESQAARLLAGARTRGIQIRLIPVETENPAAAVIAEAKRGYDLVVVPKEPRRLLPLFQKSLFHEIRGKVDCEVTEMDNPPSLKERRSPQNLIISERRERRDVYGDLKKK